MLISEHKFTQIATAIENGARIELGSSVHDDSLLRVYQDSDLIASCSGPYEDLDELFTEMDALLFEWNEAQLDREDYF
ncbi:MAG: hypothetical protein MI742_05005 [Desulfobacterales bacterium]|nr:hypothetical protein [Desulfobacterales bacterium]